MKTIARNRAKKIAEIKSAVTRTRIYTLDNGFSGQDSTVDAAFDTLNRYDFARLRDNENGTYTVTVHSNLWYELDTRPQTTPEQAEEQAAAAVEQATRVVATAADQAGPVKLPYIPPMPPKPLKPAEEKPTSARGALEQVTEATDRLPVPPGKGRFYVIPTEGERLTDRHDLLGPYGSTDMAESMAARYRAEGIDCEVLVSETRPTRIPAPGDALAELVDEIGHTTANADGSVTLDPASVDRIHDVERAHSLALAWNLLVDTAALRGDTPEALGARAVSEPPAHLRTMARVADGFEFTAVGWAAHRAREIELAWYAAHVEKTDRDAHTAECFRMGWYVLCEFEGLDREGRAACRREKSGEEILAGETPMGRSLVAATVSELTRKEKRALTGGITRRAARPTLDGLRRRSLVAGGKGDGPVRLTAMGKAVVAVLKGAPVAV